MNPYRKKDIKASKMEVFKEAQKRNFPGGVKKKDF